MKKRIYIIVILELFLVFFITNNVYAQNNSNKKKEIDFVDVLEIIFGDFPQYLSNLWVTLPSGTWKDMRVTYKYSELLAEGENGKSNQYTLVSNNIEKEDKYENRTKKIKNEKEQFNQDTEIPVMYVDLYTMSAGKVGAFDINILTGQNDKTLHPEGSFWSTVRKLIAGFVHVIIYLCTATLIITLIWHGISIVKLSITPIEKKEHKDGVMLFGKSLLKLVGAVLIMAICIYSSKMFFSYIKVGNTMELPIRVIVKGDAGYSFSTTIAGYFKYMSQTGNKELFADRCSYVFTYCFLANINLLMSIIMLIRVFLVMILSAIGPIIATASAFNINKVFGFTFKSWVIIYACLALIQTIGAVIYTAMILIVL